MRLGITGLAGAGKSTVFAALTQTPADTGHKGEERIGTVRVPDRRIDILTDMYRPRNPSPTAAATRFMDPWRTSPTAKTPGHDVSNASASRRSSSDGRSRSVRTKPCSSSAQ